MMRKIIFSMAIAATAITSTQAQYGQRLYSRDTVSHDRFTDGLNSVANPVGGLAPYVGTGVTQGNNIVERSRFVRTARAGATLANRVNFVFRGGNEHSHRLNSICEAAGRYVMAGRVTGTTVSPVPGGGDVLFVRTSAAGIINSVRTVDLSNGNDGANCIIQSTTNANRLYSCGFSELNGISRTFVMATNTTGSTVNWSRTYGVSCVFGALVGNSVANSIAEDAGTGSVYAVGNLTGQNCNNAFISRFTAAGVHVWTQIFQLPNNGLQFTSIKPHPTIANSFIISGNCLNFGLGNVTSWPLILGINVAGAAPAIVFQNCLVAALPAPFPVNGQITGMMANDLTSRLNPFNGNIEYFLAGTAVLQNGSTEGFTIKTTGVGIPISGQVYGNVATDGFNSIDRVGNGMMAGDGLVQFGYYNTNLPNVVPPGNTRCWLVKSYYNHVSGCNEKPIVVTSQIVNLLQGPFNPIINNVNLRDSMVAQQANGLAKTLCWANVIGTGSNMREPETNSISISNDIKLYPNPVDGDAILTLQVRSDKNNTAVITIMDIKGAVIDQNIIDVSEGINETTIDHSQWQRGMYFVQVQLNDQSYRTKITKN
ncbi:MAG: T9SS type A sorting domain-containing protein [Bacteroidetes bacterium]|nr:T9SS type A sorting domain-containing protein [Bacteroidota bacterium]